MFFTWELLVQIVTSFITSVAFAIMFRINRRHLINVGICGTVTFAVYYTILYFFASLFAAAFISSMVTALYAEIFARVKRAPTIVFVLPGIVPTVPGGSLYRGMRDLLLKNIDGAIDNFASTLEVGIGIAGGIVTISIIFSIILDRLSKQKSRASQNKN